MGQVENEREMVFISLGVMIDSIVLLGSELIFKHSLQRFKIGFRVFLN